MSQSEPQEGQHQGASERQAQRGSFLSSTATTKCYNLLLLHTRRVVLINARSHTCPHHTHTLTSRLLSPNGGVGVGFMILIVWDFGKRLCWARQTSEDQSKSGDDREVAVMVSAECTRVIYKASSV